MSQPTIFFTGGTSGLGRIALEKLAHQGNKIYLAGRNEAKAKQVIHSFRSSNGSSNGDIHFVHCDNNDLASVYKAIEHLKIQEEKLDVLVNNAGLWNRHFETSRDGIEQTLQTNLIAPLVLMQGLLPLLEMSSDARVVNTASALHQGSIEFNDLEFRQKFNSMLAYRQSKLGLILLTRLFHQRHANKGIGFYSQHPGVVSTNLGQDLGWIGNGFFKLFGISAERGAQTLLHLVTTSQDQLSSGEYYAKKKVKKITSTSYDLYLAEKLADHLNKLIESKATRMKVEG